MKSPAGTETIWADDPLDVQEKGLVDSSPAAPAIPPTPALAWLPVLLQPSSTNTVASCPNFEAFMRDILD
jgi:hypothetical protein